MPTLNPAPIPPLDLVDQWSDMLEHRSDLDVFTAAAQWGADAAVKSYAQEMSSIDDCLLELRARVEVLEANSSAALTGSLVNRVHSCIVGEPECGRMQAQAVIREVATWLREHGHSEASAVLEVMEAPR